MFAKHLDIGGCVSSGCQNGGTCLSNGVCLCPTSYTGTTCQTCTQKTLFSLNSIQKNKFK